MINVNSTKLKNIVENIHLLRQHRLYVFGYGSLMYASGINGRGMRKRYKNTDLRVAELTGLKRSLSMFFDNTYYYGVEKCRGASVNGVLFEISFNDLIVLALNEGSYPVTHFKNPAYAVIDATSICSVKEDGKILCFANDKLQNKLNISVANRIGHGYTKWYVSNVSEGIKHLGSKFRHKFVASGGVSI